MDLTHYVKATDCKTTIHPAIHPPTFVCSFKPARLNPLTVIEPALLPQFYLCGTSWYCVAAAQLLVMLSWINMILPHLNIQGVSFSPACASFFSSSSTILPPMISPTSFLRAGEGTNTLGSCSLWAQYTSVFLHTLGGHHQVLMRRATLPLTSPRDSCW